MSLRKSHENAIKRGSLSLSKGKGKISISGRRTIVRKTKKSISTTFFIDAEDNTSTLCVLTSGTSRVRKGTRHDLFHFSKKRKNGYPTPRKVFYDDDMKE